MLDLAESALQRNDYAALAIVAGTIAQALSKRAALLDPLLLITRHLGEQVAYRRKALDILMMAVRLVGAFEKEGAHAAQKALVEFVDTKDLSDMEGIAALNFVALRIIPTVAAHRRLKIKAIGGMVARASNLETTESIGVFRNAAYAFYSFVTPDQLQRNKGLKDLERAIINGFVDNANKVKSISTRITIFCDAANLDCPGRLLEQESVKQFVINTNLIASLATRATTFMAAARKARKNNMLKAESLGHLVSVVMRMSVAADRMPFLYDAAELVAPDLKPDVLNAIMRTGLALDEHDARLSALWYVSAHASPASDLFRAALMHYSQTLQRVPDRKKQAHLLANARHTGPDNTQALRAAVDPLLSKIESSRNNPAIPTSERARAFMANANKLG